jgi:hypothetical protein
MSGAKNALRTPLFLILALLASTSVLGAYIIEHGRLDDEVDREITSVETLMASQLGEDFQMVNATLLALGQSHLFTAALEARDRDELLEEATPLFRRMQAEADISHFYFTGPDRVNILRLHKPDQYGDVIDRFTTVEAERTGRPAQGIELGPLGTLTMRVVYPQFAHDRCVGYIELGHELGDHIEMLGEALDLDLRVLVKKKYLDKEGWESGQAAFGKHGDWERFPDFVAPIDLPTGLAAEALEILGTDDEETRKGGFETTIDGRPARVAFLPIVGASGDALGRMVIMLDITDQRAALVRFVLTVALASIALAGVFGGLLLFAVGRAAARLGSAD